jgi:hypothetical protein
MAGNAMKEEGDKSKSKSQSKSQSKSMVMSLLIRVSEKKSCKEEEPSSQVHPIIPYQLSQAWEIAKPYRPCLVLNLETIREEEDDHPPKTPLGETPRRTPLYFVKGRKARRFRFRRYAKLMWRLHSTKLRCKFKYILRFFSCIGI